MHTVNTNQRDENRTTCSAHKIRDEEALWRDGAEPGYVTHQITWEDRQDKGEEIEKYALIFGHFIPAFDDLGRSQPIDQGTAIFSGDEKCYLASKNGAG